MHHAAVYALSPKVALVDSGASSDDSHLPVCSAIRPAARAHASESAALLDSGDSHFTARREYLLAFTRVDMDAAVELRKCAARA